MIFVTLGSQKFQFNRLLVEIDKLIADGIIKEQVFAQTGYSDYKPLNYQYKNFLNQEEFNKYLETCDKVITHGGTGAIVGALKKEKKIVAVPRLKIFEEHVDDHQVEIITEFCKSGFIMSIIEDKSLGECLVELEDFRVKKYISNTNNIVNMINSFINK
ncbi:PssE/Cps14G family polysaccharide biosynthesis glycosyltransferase [Bacillus sp. FJAT-27986]|uniref:PssE/Cps14G family polysaccharide biosynthesis glycosyltransferase n=1 Tax=Bacillus sp. FJAT-27986 TaxID=1743146 RepID=UPI00080AD0F2|nr:PssE/Cps14G family polysaccharide biosynthesis glycosyltransferase [Bacillus sp. FJAT-27986]OCA84622.1 beta(1,3)galactosyltransferase EpsH [Bacillus sp. FJAT-27986]